MGQKQSANKFDQLPVEIIYLILKQIIERVVSFKEKYHLAVRLNKISRANRKLFLLTEKLWSELYQKEISRHLPLFQLSSPHSQNVRLAIPVNYLQIQFLCKTYLQALKRLKSLSDGKMLIESARCGYEVALENMLGLHPQLSLNKAFLEACKAEQLAVADYLLKMGASIRSIDQDSLKKFLKAGQLNVLKFLIHEGLQISLPFCLINSVYFGHLHLVKYFHSLGANLRYNQDQALIVAAGNGQYPIVVYLVENGSNPKARNDTPIVRAYTQGYKKTAQYLQTKGGDMAKAKREKERIEQQRASDAEIQMILAAGSITAVL